MKRLILALTLGGLILSTPCWGQPQIGVSLTTDKTEYVLGEKVGVTIGVANLSSQNLYVTENFKLHETYIYRLKILNPANQLLVPIPTLDPADSEPRPLPNDVYGLEVIGCDTLEPGWNDGATADDIRSFYDISLPGYYSVQAELDLMQYSGTPCKVNNALWQGVILSETKYFFYGGSTGVSSTETQWSLDWQTLPGETFTVMITPAPRAAVSDINTSTIRLNNIQPVSVGSPVSGAIPVTFSKQAAINSLGTTPVVGKSYYAIVSGKYVQGPSFGGSLFVTVTDWTTLAAPSNLGAVAVSLGQIDLSWTDNANNESGFKVERCTGAGCTSGFSQIGTVAANVTTYSDTTVIEGTSYGYQVRAYRTGTPDANSAYSNLASATTGVAAPAAPDTLVATAVSTSQINLTWVDKSTNESGFKIERCTGANCSTGFSQIGTAVANATSYSDMGLTEGTAYTYRVRATNTGGDSANSATATATTLVNAPAAPSGLTATAISATQINLAWTDNSTNETGFKVERCTGTSCTPTTLITTTVANATSYSDMGLTEGTAYTYRVRATNTGGDSANSATATATTRQSGTTPPAAPSNLTVTVLTSTQINLTWKDNSNNETGFKILRCEGANCTPSTLIATTAANVVTYTDSVTQSTTYGYRVVATNAGVESTATAIARATTPMTYFFTGFFSPVNNPPIVNTMFVAGQNIPMKWRLTNTSGKAISDRTSVLEIVSQSVDCTSGNPGSAVREYPGGKSNLLYSDNGYWVWNWNTLKSYAKTCRVLTLKLKDGSTFNANFKFP
jgi:hypothetical protein